MTGAPNRILERDLTPADFEVLEFERAWWKYQGRREGAVRERFGTPLPIHVRRMHALIDHPQAAAYDPTLVRKLRERRDASTNRRRQEALILEETR